MSFEQTVEFAAGLGIAYVQFFERHLDPRDPAEVNLAKRAFMKERGVEAYALGVGGTTLNKEENRALFELAKLFDIGVIVVEPIDQAIWDNLEELAIEYDIRLAIHNHGRGTVYGNPSAVKHVLAERDGRIGVCLDIGWVTAAGFDVADVYRNYGGRVYDMHLKDKRLDKRDSIGRPSDTLLGLGNTNFVELVEHLRADDWDGVLAIEADSAAFARDPQAYVAAARRWFDENFSE